MQELFPGLYHWTAAHPKIGIEVSSHYVAASGTAIDPLLPDCPILAHEDGLHEFEDGPAVQGFGFGDQVADDVAALTMDAISPDDTALRIDAAQGALLFADSVVNHGGLGFVPDRLIGDEPERVKRTILGRVTDLLDEEFDHLLFAHGDPVVGGGKELLRAFAQVD